MVLTYIWLLKYLPTWAAVLVTALWFTLLLTAVVYFGMTVPEAEFRYGEI